MSDARKIQRGIRISTIVFCALSFGLAGCGGDKIPGATDQADNTTKTDSALPVVQPNYPGPYSTMTIGDQESRLGRFPVGKKGGTLTRSIISADPKTFNPWAANDSSSTEMSGLMFSGVVTQDFFSGDVIPDMAETLTVDPDGVTYTTRLRKGLKWSDGKPITADDVMFTWNTIIAGGYGNSSLKDVCSIDGKLPTVTKIDDLTNKFVTPKPFAPFARMMGIAVAPKHIIEPIIKGKNGRQAFESLWSTTLDPKSLVTSGPFTLSRFVAGQRVEFEPNKAYYEVNKDKEKLPYLQKIVYQIVPDPNVNLLKFLGDELDITNIRAKDLSDVLPKQEQGNFKVWRLGPTNGSTFMVFNMNQRKNPKTNKPYVDPIKSAWFNDTNFRQAINHAINRDEMVANYFKGVGAPEFEPMPASSQFFDSDLKPFKASAKEATDYLSKSGFTKKDGLLYDKAGNKVEFNLVTSAGSTFYEATGNIIVQNLKQLGMTVHFNPLNFNVLNDKVSNAMDFDVCLMSLTGDPLEPNNGANVYNSTGRMHIFDQRLPDDKGVTVAPDARPWEKRIDALMSKGAQTMDKGERHKIYNEVQQILYDEVPFVYTVTSESLVAARNTIQNFDPTPLSQDTAGLHNLEEIWKKDQK